MLRCCTSMAQRNTSFTCTSPVSSLSSLPTLENGLSLLERTTSSMPGEHLMVQVYFRYTVSITSTFIVSVYFCLLYVHVAPHQQNKMHIGKKRELEGVDLINQSVGILPARIIAAVSQLARGVQIQWNGILEWRNTSYNEPTLIPVGLHFNSEFRNL